MILLAQAEKGETTLSSVRTQDPLFLILLTMRILPILILTRSTTVLCHAFQLILLIDYHFYFQYSRLYKLS